MRNSNQPQVSALAHSVLASLSGTRATADYLRGLLSEVKVLLGCADCGYREDARALDFAHVDATTKYRTRTGRREQPSDMAKAGRDGFPRYSQTIILAEIAKCDILCATCHRVRTFEAPRRVSPHLALGAACKATATGGACLVCCYCDNTLAPGSRVCPTCREYKGVMSCAAYAAYLKIPAPCNC